MTDHGRAPARFIVVTDERLLDATECAERRGVSVETFKKLARRSPALLAGKREDSRRTRWLQSALVEHLHNEIPREREHRLRLAARRVAS